MEGQYRYRLIKLGFSRMLTFGLFFLAVWGGVSVVLGVLGMGLLGVVLSFEEAASTLAVIWAFAMVAGQVLAIMAALGVCMKWGRYAGARLQFVRPNLADAALKKGS